MIRTTLASNARLVQLCSPIVATFLACSGATGAEGDSLSDQTSSTGGESNGNNVETETGSGIDTDIDPSLCGNGLLDAGEACDGTTLTQSECSQLPGFVGGQLGCSTGCTFDTTACEVDPGTAVVRLNELTSEGIDEGPYAGAGDAIELYNAGGVAADLSGWQISDDDAFPADKTYTFPAGASLAPGGFLVLVQLDDVTGQGDYPFGISASGPETITLIDTTESTIDAVSFMGPLASESWCRIPDATGEWRVCGRTFGSANDPESDPTGGDAVCGDGVATDNETCDGADLRGAECSDLDPTLRGELACDATCEYDTSGCAAEPADPVVVINELTSSGNDTIELFNTGPGAVDLSGYVLTDELANADDPYDPDADLEALVFPAGTTIGAGEFLAIDRGEIPLHPFGLGAAGDAVTLLDPAYAVVDFVDYGADEAVTSYCRMPDGPDGEWQADCDPTFGASNG